MKPIVTITLGLLLAAGIARPCAAQWGWPPPGYSTSTRCAADGSHYRGLREVWRDWRCRRRGEVAPATVVPNSTPVASSSAPAAVPAVPQPAPPTLPAPR